MRALAFVSSLALVIAACASAAPPAGTDPLEDVGLSPPLHDAARSRRDAVFSVDAAVVRPGFDAAAPAPDARTPPADAAGHHDAEAPSPDARTADAALPDPWAGVFPVEYDTSRIGLVEERPFEGDGRQFALRFYRNLAYRCGRSGHFTFAVVEETRLAGQSAPLWVLMRGGGIGYYDAQRRYHGDEPLNDEFSFDMLLQVVVDHVLDGEALKDTTVTRRIREGYRVLVPSLCDHDLYSGMGNAYPDNPNYGAAGDTVDGLLATMAAVDYTAHGSAAYPTGRVFLHGTSAGSAGAWSVAHAFARGGVRLNGAVLDAYLVTDRLIPLLNTGCTLPQRDDPQFDMAAVVAKVGLFVDSRDLFAENSVGGPHEVPLFDIVGGRDGFCCGDRDLIPEAAQAGYNNNCAYAHGLLDDAVRAQAGLHRTYYDRDGGHVLTPQPGPLADEISAWLGAVLARNPPAPWPIGN